VIRLRIEKVEIEGFGKFKDFEIEFGKKLNLIYGPNNAGKTTLANFIRYILSGARVEEMERYRPWYHNVFRGRLFVETEEGKEVINLDLSKRSYLIERDLFDLSSFLPETYDGKMEKSADRRIILLLREKYAGGELVKDVEKALKRGSDVFVVRKKRVIEEIDEIEKELKMWREKKREVLALRKERILQEKRLNNLLEEYENMKKKFEEEQERKVREIRDKLKELREKVNYLEEEKSKKSYLMKLNVENLKEALVLDERISELNEELNKLMERKKDLIAEIKELRMFHEDFLRKAGDRSIAEVELRLRNARLLLDMKKRERRISIDQTLSKVEDVLSEISEELEKERYRLESLEKDFRDIRKKAKKDLIKSLLFLAGAGIFLILGMMLSKYFHIGSVALAFLSVVYIFATRLNRMKADSVEEEIIESNIAIRNLERRRKDVFKELKGIEGITGFESINELREKLEKMIISSPKLERIDKEILSILKDLGYEESEDVESVLAKAEEDLNKVKGSIMKLKDAEMKLENLTNRERSLRTHLEEFVKQRDKILEDNGCKGIDDVKRILKELEDLNRIEESIARKRKDVEKYEMMLKELETRGKSEEIVKLEKIIEREREKLESLKVPNLETPEDLFLKLEEKRKELSRLEARISAYPYVESFLKSIREEIISAYKDDLAGSILRNSSRFSSDIDNFIVESDLSLRVFISNRVFRPSEILGGAFLNILSLLYKISIHDLLELDLPLILDNPFVNLDDRMIGIMMDFLKEISERRQVIFLTSDTRVIQNETYFELS